MKKFLVAALLLLGLAFAIGCAGAQEQPAPAAAPSAAQQGEQSPPAVHAPPQGTNQELAKTSEEAAGEGTEQFKESASVKFLGRLTGLSPLGAYWLAIIINFAIVAGAIVWFLRSSLPKFFRSRTSSIQQQIEEAKRASADAQKRLADVQARLSRLDEEIAALHSAAEQEAAAEQQRIRAAGEEDRAKIVDSARAEIEAARRQAQTSLKAFAADLAVGLAAQRMNIDSTTDQQLVHSFAEELREEGK